jgi:hypothetical protein
MKHPGAAMGREIQRDDPIPWISQGRKLEQRCIELLRERGFALGQRGMLLQRIETAHHGKALDTILMFFDATTSSSE